MFGKYRPGGRIIVANALSNVNLVAMPLGMALYTLILSVF